MSVGAHWEGHDLFGLFDLSLLKQKGTDAWIVGTLQRCASWFRASGASVFLLDPDGSYRLRCRTGDMSQVPEHAVIELGHGIAGTVLESGVPRIFGDPSEDPVLSSQGVEANTSIGSSMIVPLVSPSGSRVGVLNLSRSVSQPSFSKPDLDQAAQLGAHVAMAVANATLVGLLQKSLEAENQKSEQLAAVLAAVAGTVRVFDAGGVMEGDPLEPGSLAHEAGQAARAVVETGRGTETRVHDAPSDRTWIVHAAPMSSGGGVVTVQEVTAHQRAQDEAARMRRLAEMGQMTASIAHELRNPLTGIRAAAQLIKSDPSIGGEYAGVIEDEADKMGRLCDEFLNLSRPMKLQLGQGKLSDVARRVGSLWRREFDDAEVGLVLPSTSDDPVVELDASKVEQVVHNLLRNALQASLPGSRVVIEVNGESLVVLDSGQGMDEETQSRLFAPFFTTKSNGTGLGLCNVRRIVDAHGGAVKVWSEPGKGSRIEVSFGRSAA